MVDENSTFANELEQYLDQISDIPKPGDLRQGIIVSVSPQGVIIDLGLKRDGLVPPNDLQELSEEERADLKVDDEVTVSIVSTSDQESLTVSIYKARVLEDWEKAEALQKSGEVFEVLIDGYNKGGLICPFGRLRGFIPLSHMTGFSRGLDERERQRKMAKIRGESIAVKVIEVDSQRQRLVFSQREGQKEWEAERKREFIESLKPGEIVSGRVRSLQNFGAFIDLGPADGLIHISELAWYRVDHPRDVLKVGEEIDAKVLRVDPERLRVSLSRKPLLTNPWTQADEKYSIGQLVEGKIVRITDYGAFVQIEPGIEGLLHVSQLSRSPVQDVREIVADGETHLLRIISIQSKRQRIGLSLKQVSAYEQIEWMTQKSAAEAAAAEEEEVTTAETTDEVIETVVEATEDVIEVTDDGTDAVTETITETTDEVVDTVVETTDDVVETVTEVTDEVTETITETTDEVVDTVVETTDDVVETVTEVTDEVTETTDAVVDTVAETIDDVVEVADDATDEVTETVAETADDVIDTVADATAEATDDVIDVTDDAADEVVEAAAQIVDDGTVADDSVDDFGIEESVEEVTEPSEEV
ncbi:MAG: S1 RNA-binding domain-containing protein [Anaerolineae bacterium]|nr:S1 RNA-binding domain-containing protein [Anaerolineae bacterium]